MARNLKITLYIADKFECNIKNVVDLLEKIGWSITDKNGKTKFFNKSIGDWDISTKLFNNCFSITDEETYFQIFHANGQIAEVYINDKDNSFSIWIEAYAKKCISNHEFYDYNWYYENIVNRINEEQCIVERVVFDEY